MWILLGFLGTGLESTDTMHETKLSTLYAETIFSVKKFFSVINKVYVTALCTLKFLSRSLPIQHKVGLQLPVLSYQPGPLEELQIG